MTDAPIKVKRFISGGQTGADQAGILAASVLGFETGGWAPKGWKTEDGPAPWLAKLGLQESISSNYQVRTAQNVAEAEVTLWFGKTDSPGYWCTRKAAEAQNKPFYENPNTDEFLDVCDTYEVVNIAGNRKRLNPKVDKLVGDVFQALRERLGR